VWIAVKFSVEVSVYFGMRNLSRYLFPDDSDPRNWIVAVLATAVVVLLTQPVREALHNALDRLLPAARTVAIDSGHFMGYPAMYLRVPDERGFVFTQAFQAVGLGLGTAIGAAVARPDRLTVAALGDGGTMLGLPDLETVARLGLQGGSAAG